MTKNGKIDFAQDAFLSLLPSGGSQFSFRCASQAIKGGLNGSKAMFFQARSTSKSPKAEISPNKQLNR